MSRLKDKYRKEVIDSLTKKFSYSSIMAVPRIEKVILNMGVGKAVENKKLLDNALEELSLIAGQKAVKTLAKKSISNFKLRKGMAIGCMVTLRDERMYNFLDRMINVALPRVRDFKGVSAKAFDGKGNYNLSIREQVIFPEISYDKIETVQGMNITIVTTANTDEEGRELLKNLGMPFRKK